MKYKIKEKNNEYQVFEVIDSGGIDMNGKTYEPILWQIDTCRTKPDAEKLIDKITQQRDVYDMNQITNYR